MEKLLFIAEKPSLMRDCESTYRRNFKSIPYDIDFVALAGHVCGFVAPKEYDEWNTQWKNITIPMVPSPWKIDIIEGKNKLVKDIKDKITHGGYDGIICGTDPDREGSLIYYLLASKLGILKKKTYRFWVHDLTDKGIMDAFNSMVDMSKDTFQKNLTEASILRSKFDWLIGMNFTVAATVHTNSLMKIGRVKTPTLKIVYDNCMAIDNFKPVTTYEIESVYKEGFSGAHVDTRYKTKEEAEKIIKSLGKTASVTNVEKKTVKTAAPQLYKLSSLQIDASKAYGFTPDRTLELVQGLYEKHKLVSYPRTDCCFVSTALAKDFSKLLKACRPVTGMASVVDGIPANAQSDVTKNKKYVNDAEVNKSSHTALVPTGKIPDLSLITPDEEKILTMIYKRFIAIFLPNLVEEKCVVITKNDGNGMEFKSNGKVVVDRGYTAIYDTKIEDNELPALKKGQSVNVKEFKINDKTTTPPARLTEGTLIKEMENISKYIDDKELKDVMSEAAGIGTPATRGAIISSLISDGYIEAKKSKKVASLYITEMGKTYIENLIGFSIVSPELTAEWEKKLKEIEQSELDAKTFEIQMLDFINEVSKEMKTAEMKKSSERPGSSSAAGEVIAKCPKCGKNIYENSKAFSCEDRDCGCVIFKDDKFFNSIGKKMNKTTAKKLFNDKKIKVTGCRSKSGKTYDAIIKVSFEGKYANYSMEFDNSDKDKDKKSSTEKKTTAKKTTTTKKKK